MSKIIDIFNTKKHETIEDKIVNELKNRYGFKAHTEHMKMYKPGPKTPTFADLFILYPFAPTQWHTPNILDHNLDYAKRIVAQATKPKESALDAALRRLKEFADSLDEEEKSYDFMFMGKPVKFYDKFIQIGSNIIPTLDYKPYFSNLTERKKENIINLIINISNEETIINNTFEIAA